MTHANGGHTGAVASADLEDHWTGIEDEIVSCLRDNGPMPPAQLGERLGMSEDAATSLIALLARSRKVRICLVELAGEPAGR